MRNWCLTRALDVTGELNLQRFRTHVPREREVLMSDPSVYVEILRVMLDSQRAGDRNERIAWPFDDGSIVGLYLHGGVAVPDDGDSADLAIEMNLLTWARIMSNKQSLEAALMNGEVIVVNGSESGVCRFFKLFDHPALH